MGTTKIEQDVHKNQDQWKETFKIYKKDLHAKGATHLICKPKWMAICELQIS